MSQMPPTAFIAMLLPAALACQREHGIPASFTIAQAALESGWGQRALGNNLFGVKADKSWNGPVVDFVTQEVIKGARVTLTDEFRAYTSWDDCMRDRAEFFRNNPRYAKCFAEKSGAGWARAVAAAGYATDPNYAESLIAVMRGRNLCRYDAP